MADKRMFTMKIVDSDAFLDMPLSTQCLYFHLNMRADDDGFIGNPKKIMRMVGATDDDLRLLIAKRFLLTFDNGVIVIKHWRMHNTLSKQRYHETVYKDEKCQLLLKENKSYSLNSGNSIDDSRLIETFNTNKSEDLHRRTSGEQTENKRRTSGEQTENSDLGLGLDIGLDIDLGLDNNSNALSYINNINNGYSTSSDHNGEECFIDLPTKEETPFIVTYKYAKELESLYQSVNVWQELRSMKGWLNADDARLKTSRGIKKFITGWLNRSQKEATTEANASTNKGKWQELAECAETRKDGLF